MQSTSRRTAEVERAEGGSAGKVLLGNGRHAVSCFDRKTHRKTELEYERKDDNWLPDFFPRHRFLRQWKSQAVRMHGSRFLPFRGEKAAATPVSRALPRPAQAHHRSQAEHEDALARVGQTRPRRVTKEGQGLASQRRLRLLGDAPGQRERHANDAVVQPRLHNPAQLAAPKQPFNRKA